MKQRHRSRGQGLNILILGGCGFVGSSIARDLVKSEGVGHVRLADILPDLGRVHQPLKANPKVSAEFIDIRSDFSTLVEATAASDVVVNCVGPYADFGTVALKAAIEAGVDYADVCDDGHMALEFFAMDKEVKRAGICAVTGLGVTPGLTNVLARHAVNKLDSVEEIDVDFIIAMVNPLGKAGLTQAIGQFDGKVNQFIDGHVVEVPGGSDPEEVVFPKPFGMAQVCCARHPESVTLPRYISGLKRVVNKAAFHPSSAVKMFGEVVRWGLFDTKPLSVNGTPVIPREFIVAFLQRTPALRSESGLGASFACNVVVKGRRAKSQVTFTCQSVGWGGPMVAIPASVGIQFLGQGRVGLTGVVAPEGVFDPDEILRYLSRRGFVFYERETIQAKLRVI